MKPNILVLSLFAVMILIACCLSLTSCATTLPSEFSGVTLSENDKNIVLSCEAVRQNLGVVEIGVSTATPFILNQFIKQPVTLMRVGGVTYIVGSSLKKITSNQGLSPTIVSDSATNLKTSLSPVEQTVANAILNNAQSAYNALYSHLESLAASASDPEVKQYVLATIPLVANAVGSGLVDATSQYAPKVAINSIYTPKTYYVKAMSVRPPHGEKDPYHVLLAKK